MQLHHHFLLTPWQLTGCQLGWIGACGAAHKPVFGRLDMCCDVCVGVRVCVCVAGCVCVSVACIHTHLHVRTHGSACIQPAI